MAWSRVLILTLPAEPTIISPVLRLSLPDKVGSNVKLDRFWSVYVTQFCEYQRLSVYSCCLAAANWSAYFLSYASSAAFYLAAASAICWAKVATAANWAAFFLAAAAASAICLANWAWASLSAYS